LVGPIGWVIYKTGSNWVVSNVFPFLCTRFVVSQKVVEEAFLPLEIGERGLLAYRLTGPFFPLPDVGAQLSGLFQARTEKVYMIRHDHISADCPRIPVKGSGPFADQNVSNFIGSQDRHSLFDTGSNKIGWIFRPHVFQTRRSHFEKSQLEWDDRST
jgi:hypothetical protein